MLGEAVFVLLSARAGGRGWGPPRGSQDRGIKTECKKGASTEAGLGLLQQPGQQSRLREVCGVGELEPLQSLTTAPPPPGNSQSAEQRLE